VEGEILGWPLVGRATQHAAVRVDYWWAKTDTAAWAPTITDSTSVTL